MMSRNTVRWHFDGLSACNLQELSYEIEPNSAKAKTPSGKLDIPLVYEHGLGPLADLDLTAIGGSDEPGAQKHIRYGMYSIGIDIYRLNRPNAGEGKICA